MNVSSIGIAAFGSAAIATPPTNDAVANAKSDDKPAEAPSAQQVTQAAKTAGAGQLVDKTA